MNWLTGWGKRKLIFIPLVKSNQTDINVFYQASYDPLMNADFSDVRFTDDDGTTVLYHYEVKKVNSVSCLFAIKIPALTANTRKIIGFYYSNGSAPSVSDGNNTFPFFDDFSGTLAKWDVTGGVSIAGGVMVLPAGNSTAYTKLKYSGTKGVRFRIRYAFAHYNNSGYDHGGFLSAGGMQAGYRINGGNPAPLAQFNVQRTHKFPGYMTTEATMNWMLGITQYLDNTLYDISIEKGDPYKTSFYINDVLRKELFTPKRILSDDANITGGFNHRIPELEYVSYFFIYNLPADSTPWPVLKLSGDISTNLEEDSP